MKTFYRRKLPHLQPPESSFFVTFRLHNSIPVSVLNRMKQNHQLVMNGIIDKHELSEKEQKELIILEQKRLFIEQDHFLDKNPNGPYWLSNPEIGQIIANEMNLHRNKWYILWAYCIMSNHVHILLTTLKGAPALTKIMQNIKGYSAQKSNKILERDGQFWERESYDHLVRNDSEFERIVKYILNNPVKANLVREWTDWSFTFVHPELTVNV